jgi:hypothetical protein
MCTGSTSVQSHRCCCAPQPCRRVGELCKLLLLLLVTLLWPGRLARVLPDTPARVSSSSHDTRSLHQFAGTSGDTNREAQPRGQGAFTPVSSDATFHDAMADAAQSKQIGFLPGMVMQPCWQLVVPADMSIVVNCADSTLDLQCKNTGVVLGTGARLSLQQCHVVWPRDRPFFNTVGAGSPTMQLGENAELKLSGGSSSLVCSVRSRLPLIAEDLCTLRRPTRLLLMTVDVCGAPHLWRASSP